nr:hypothetical protein [Kibdelosporangium sp. MJ126-NF4]
MTTPLRTIIDIAANAPDQDRSPAPSTTCGASLALRCQKHKTGPDHGSKIAGQSTTIEYLMHLRGPCYNPELALAKTNATTLVRKELAKPQRMGLSC